MDKRYNLSFKLKMNISFALPIPACLHLIRREKGKLENEEKDEFPTWLGMNDDYAAAAAGGFASSGLVWAKKTNRLGIRVLNRLQGRSYYNTCRG